MMMPPSKYLILHVYSPNAGESIEYVIHQDALELFIAWLWQSLGGDTRVAVIGSASCEADTRLYLEPN